MISIVPKPQMLTVRPGQMRIGLPLTMRGSAGAQATIESFAALLGENGLIVPADSQVHLDLHLDSGLRSRLGREGYTLDIASAGVQIRAAQPVGLFYGLQTLRQLLPPNIAGEKQNHSLTLPCLSITDNPLFPWRGFMLDEARHFFGAETVKRVLDWLAFLKINTFHWHLTDYQGWRVEIRKYPKLTAIGGRRSGSQTRSFVKRFATMDMTPHEGWYSQRDIREIVAYAAERQITIVPEFDLPGHFTAALAAYPHLGCTKEPMEVRCTYGIYPDVVCVGNPETRGFLRDVLDELCELFPGTYIHLGGDEVKTEHWESCPDCRRLVREEGLQSFAELNTFIMNDLGGHLLERGKTPVVWNEALRPALNKDVVVMHWTPGRRAMKRTKQALRDGYQVVFQTWLESYFDYPHSMVPLRQVYRAKTFDDLLPDRARNVLGTQGALWTEFVEDEARIQWNGFPRLAAKAEVGWSQPQVRDYADFRDRWADLTPYLRHMGLANYAPLEACDPSLCRRVLGTLRDATRDVQSEQKHWQEMQ
jgi:hexosaminidase